VGATDETIMYVTPLVKSRCWFNELGMEAREFNHGEISFVSRCTMGCKWLGRAGHGGPRKDSRIFEGGLALVL
jgi:hypothetical protein